MAQGILTQAINGVILRSPDPDEGERVSYLFRDVALPQKSQLLLAVKMRPVERFLGGLAGWVEGEFARFHLAFQPGVDRRGLARLLIDEAANTARSAGIFKLLYGELLADDDERALLLREIGFEIIRSERFFRIDAALAARRTQEFMTKFARIIPPTWRTKSIRSLSYEAVLDLIAPFRLMPPAEVQRLWQSTARNGFELDMSSLLYDGDRVFGALLIRRSGDVLTYDVRVVNHPNARLRGLANLCLFWHCLEKYDARNPVRWLQFKGGEMEHRETANVAFRMGGEEMAPRRLLGKTI
jgi:ribosomal protein S18 acetylase RimI-like enzyme